MHTNTKIHTHTHTHTHTHYSLDDASAREAFVELAQLAPCGTKRRKLAKPDPTELGKGS